MMFTTPMKHLIAVVLQQDSEKVTKELLNQGLLDFVRVVDVSEKIGAKVDNSAPAKSGSEIAEMRRRIEFFLNMAGYKTLSPDSLDVEKLHEVDLEETSKSLDKLASQIQDFRDRQKNIQGEILKHEDIKRQLSSFKDFSTDTKNIKLSFLNFHSGSVLKSRLENITNELKQLPSVQIDFNIKDEERAGLFLITMKRDDARINPILERYGWIDMDSAPQEAFNIEEKVHTDLGQKIADLKEEQDKIALEIKSIITKKKPVLDELWANLRMNELFYKIQAFYSKTSKTVVFTGWIPKSKQKFIEDRIKKVTESKYYIEWNNPEGLAKAKLKKMKVPVELNNPKFLSPFQMLVKNYSIPEYGTIDPTPIVAIAYLMMFGLMFGDAGHGIVIFIIGLIGTLISRKKQGAGKDLTFLLVYCGLSAIVTGILFGSYFGMPLFKPLWFDYHKAVLGHGSGGPVNNIYGILKITVLFGIAVISIGLLLNWINLIFRKKYFKLFFDKAGILGGWMYGAGLYTAFYFVKAGYKALPDSNLLFKILGIPALIFVLKAPIEFIIHKAKDSRVKFTGFTLIDFIMDWVVEMLEIFSGYLANTLSFMRVAGLGIAHVSLMVAFFQIAEMAGGFKNGINPAALTIMIFGNILVIGMEGLSAGIQSLRLNYYEFFSKYFIGNGKAYAPISLRNRE